MANFTVQSRPAALLTLRRDVLDLMAEETRDEVIKVYESLLRILDQHAKQQIM